MSVSIKLIDGEDPKSLYQYDIGRQIQIITNGGETIKEVQFSNVRLPEALIVLPKLDESGNVIADVPNVFTLDPRRISVYLITYLENGECVKYKDELNVIPRKKPSDYVYTETEVLNYSLLEKQINSLQSTKLTAPSSAQIGQIFQVKSINDDGNLVLEAVDMPSGGSGGAVDDVQIDGQSIVGENGVAEIPKMDLDKSGLIQFRSGYGLQLTGNYLLIDDASEEHIKNRVNRFAVTGKNFDYAVKCAMCDGKGAAWTTEEQAMARARMGATSHAFKTLLDYTVPDGETLGAGVYNDDIIVIEDISISEMIISIAVPPIDSFPLNAYGVEANSGLEINVTEDGVVYKDIGTSAKLSSNSSNIIYAETCVTFMPGAYTNRMCEGLSYNSPSVSVNAWTSSGLRPSTMSGIVTGLKLKERYPNGQILPSGTRIKIYGR